VSYSTAVRRSRGATGLLAVLATLAMVPACFRADVPRVVDAAAGHDGSVAVDGADAADVDTRASITGRRRGQTAGWIPTRIAQQGLT
jgi:hypothetical protein